jgi:hypothetical protein
MSNGAALPCPDCKTRPKLGVYRSAAGYYVGSYCRCGPYSRESAYFRTRAEAVLASEIAGGR